MVCASVSLLLSLYISLVSGAFLDFRLDTADQNVLILECYDSELGTIDSGATIDFFVPGSSVPHMSLTAGQDNAGLPHTVTPVNEALLRCTTRDGSQTSDPMVAIAAVPASYSGVPQVNKAVFNGDTGELTCPIVLGKLYNDLEPYEISWEQIEDGLLPLPVTNEDLLSSDNTVLSMPIDNSTASNVYQCILQLRRCDIVDPVSGNKCQSKEYRGPLMGFRLFETIQVISRPMRQNNLPLGSTASFNCMGSGSFLDITWRFDFPSNDQVFCSNESCGHAALSYSESTSENLINTTLEVDTSQLGLDTHSIMELDTYTILCILQESIEPDMGLVKSMDQPFSTTMTITVPPAQLPNTTMASTTMAGSSTTGTVATTMETSIPVAITAVIAVAVIGIIVVIVILLLVLGIIIYKKRSKKDYPVTPSESQDNDPPTIKPNRIYEELPESRLIVGTEENYQHPFRRQIGIACDPYNPKVGNFYQGSSEVDHHSKSGGGSDLSGLSGVSGNVPGAHKMPTYSQDPSVVSGEFLQPPAATWRLTENTSTLRQTQSTIAPCYHQAESNCRHRSATEVCRHSQAQHNGFPPYNNYEAVNIDYLPPPLGLGPVPGPFPGPSPAHSCASCTSSASSFRKSSDPRHSQHNISSSTLLQVMTCLMHNKDCEINGCACKQLQHHLRHLEASNVPLQQKKSPERRSRRPKELLCSSSTESDSDVPSKKACMRLRLTDKLHPHYHLSSHSHKISATSTVETHRRSRSMSDLTPITEIHETLSPQVGGAIKPGTPIHCGQMLGEGSIDDSYVGPTKEELLQQSAVTPHSKPCPPLLREISLSSDNLPVLCLNSCLLQLNSPSPNRRRGRSLGDSSKLARQASSKPVLQPLREVSNGMETDDSNTSSRSDSPAENDAAKSDNDEGVDVSLGPHMTPHTTRPSVRRDVSSGYESEGNTTCTGVTVRNKPPSHIRHVSPSNSLHDLPPHSKGSNTSLRDLPQHSKGHMTSANSLRDFPPHSKSHLSNGLRDLSPRARSQVSSFNSLRDLPQHNIGRVSPKQRSCSPFETETTVSCDGAVIKTTEC